jgi:hypothetical protein
VASGRRNGAGWCGLVMMIATHTSRGPWHNVILTPVCSVSLLHVTRRHYPRAAPHEMSTYLLIAEGSPVATAVAFPSSDIHHACHMTKDWRPQKQILCNGALPCLNAYADWCRPSFPVTPHCNCTRMYILRDMLRCLGSIGSRHDTRATEAEGRLMVDWRFSPPRWPADRPTSETRTMVMAFVWPRHVYDCLRVISWYASNSSRIRS